MPVDRNLPYGVFFSIYVIYDILSCGDILYITNCQLEFAAIYAVLLQNLICRDLRAFTWRKIGPKIVSMEKKGQMSGMRLT